MILENLDRVLAMIPEDARVLDVGGCTAPLNRADWMLDIMPYERRGSTLPNGLGPGPERFTADTWVQRDICDKEPYPFEDDFFDFVFCSQTLEDLRDPIWVCQEMGRIGKRGYIDVPSLIDELTWQTPEPSGGNWLGHFHHRWLITVEDDQLVFLHKAHSIHSEPRCRVPPRWAKRLPQGHRGLGYFWEGAPKAHERVITTDYPPYGELEDAIVDYFQPTVAGRLALRAERQLLDLYFLRDRAARFVKRLAPSRGGR